MSHFNRNFMPAIFQPSAETQCWEWGRSYPRSAPTSHHPAQIRAGTRCCAEKRCSDTSFSCQVFFIVRFRFLFQQTLRFHLFLLLNLLEHGLGIAEVSSIPTWSSLSATQIYPWLLRLCWYERSLFCPTVLKSCMRSKMRKVCNMADGHLFVLWLDVGRAAEVRRCYKKKCTLA